MFDRRANFIDECLAGNAMLADIDAYVGWWHDGEGAGELHEFLGMTQEEYNLWVERPNSLKAILLAHKEGISLKRALEWCSSGRMAAQGAVSTTEARKILEWLKRTGRSN